MYGLQAPSPIQLVVVLFFLVGFQFLFIAIWIPWDVRLPHMIEILFDEFVYAGALGWLLRTEKEKMNLVRIASNVRGIQN